MERTRTKAKFRCQPAQLPEHLNQRLCRYADAAVATAAMQRTNWNLPVVVTVSAVGLAALALPPFAAGEVVYTPANQTVFHGERGGLVIDFNNDGIPDGSLSVYGSSRSYQENREMSAFARFGNGLMMTANRTLRQYVSAAEFGKVIGPEEEFASEGDMARCIVGETSRGRRSFHSSRGPWRSVHERYLGFKFQIDGEVHYAWARFNTSGFPEPQENSRGFVCNAKGTLTGYAYETIPDKPIVAGVIPDAGGNMRNPPVPNPELQNVTGSTLGVLASGAFGMGVWRKTAADTH